MGTNLSIEEKIIILSSLRRCEQIQELEGKELCHPWIPCWKECDYLTRKLLMKLKKIGIDGVELERRILEIGIK